MADDQIAALIKTHEAMGCDATVHALKSLVDLCQKAEEASEQHRVVRDMALREMNDARAEVATLREALAARMIHEQGRSMTEDDARDIVKILFAKANTMGLAGVDEFDAAKEIQRLRTIEFAARRYFLGYVQDEADDPELGVPGQHNDAVALKEALGI